MFYNYSSAPFTYTWGKIPYTFEPGKTYEGVIIADDKVNSIFLNETLSEFFAKHLAEHVLNTPALNTNFVVDKSGNEVETRGYPQKYNITSIEMLTKRGITPPEVEMPMPKFVDELPVLQNEGTNDTVTSEASVEEPEVSEAPKRRGRPPKAKVEESSPSSPEAEFNV